MNVKFYLHCHIRSLWHGILITIITTLSIFIYRIGISGEGTCRVSAFSFIVHLTKSAKNIDFIVYFGTYHFLVVPKNTQNCIFLLKQRSKFCLFISNNVFNKIDLFVFIVDFITFDFPFVCGTIINALSINHENKPK